MSQGETRHCLDPWLNAFIQYNGDVNPCCFVRTVWGNVHRDTAHEIFESAAARDLRRQLLEGDLRGSCIFCPARPMVPLATLREAVEGLFNEAPAVVSDARD